MKGNGAVKILIDTDIGSEMTDALALVLAAISSEVEILGVTICTGDTRFRASVAKLFLSQLGKNHVPVAAGYGDKKSQHIWEKALIFPSGYRELPFDKREAYKLINNTVNENKGEVVLVGIGPLTNIAKALEFDPTLPQKVKRLVVMGGMMEPPIVDGERIPRGFEYNFCQDSLSAERVIRAGFDLVLVPGDLTFRQDNPWTRENLEDLKQLNHPVTNLLWKLSERSLTERKRIFRGKGIPISLARPWVNDEILMSYIINPQEFKTKQILVEWSLPDKYPRLALSDTGCKLSVVYDAPLPRVRDFIIRRLKDEFASKAPTKTPISC